MIYLREPGRQGSVIVIRGQTGDELRLAMHDDPVVLYDIPPGSSRAWDIDLLTTLQAANIFSPGVFTLQWQSSGGASNEIFIVYDK